MTKFDPGAVDAEVYCMNTTKSVFMIETSSESFTTVDPENGDTVEHGSSPVDVTLQPGEVVLVADVKGWEWDGHVGLEVIFSKPQNKFSVTHSYNLKESSKDFYIPSIDKNGRTIAPMKFSTRRR